MAKLGIFLKNYDTTFSMEFFSTFLCFLCIAQEWNTKKLLKTKHKSTFVYNINFTIFSQFLGIFAALWPCFYYFYNFFRGSEVSLERCDSYGNFGYLKKN